MKTILVVDDEDDFRTMVGRVLTGQGYDVLEASNGREAALVYAEQRPDLVMADLIMPEMEGFQLIKILRRLDEHVKIIVVTGGGRGDKTNYLFMAREMGAGYTMEKPFSAEQLLSVVRLALEPGPALTGIAVA